MRLSGAAKKTRTSTGFRPQRPQRCASTNSAMAALAPTGRRAPLAKGVHPRNRLVGSFPVSQSSHYGTARLETGQRMQIRCNRPAVNRVSALCDVVNAALTGGDDIAAPLVARRCFAYERCPRNGKRRKPCRRRHRDHHPGRSDHCNAGINRHHPNRPAIQATRFRADGRLFLELPSPK